MKLSTGITFVALLVFSSAVFAGPKDVVVINDPDVNVVNTPDVVVTNTETNPLPVRSTAGRTPVVCVVPRFTAPNSVDAPCFSSNIQVTPVAAGKVLAITDVIATSQLPYVSLPGQAIVRVSNRNENGVQFGTGVSMTIKPGETVSLHYQTPHQVLPAGRTPVASAAMIFGDVFPVDVYITGYLVAEDDFGR